MRACGTMWCGSKATAGSPMGIGTTPDSMSQRCGIGGGGGCALVRGRMAVGKIEHEIEGRAAE
jgi:hypothetical protein